MEFLDAVAEPAAGSGDVHVADQLERVVVVAREGDDLHGLGFGLLRRVEDVRALAAGADGEEDVAGLPVGFDIATKDVLEPIVVSDAGDVRRIGDRDGGVGGAIVAVAAGELLGEVHGVAHGPAVAAGHHLSSASQTVCEQRSRRRNRCQRRLVFAQAGQCGRRVGQRLFDPRVGHRCGGYRVACILVPMTAIHRDVEALRAGGEPRLIARMPSGWAVMGREQLLPGYCLLLPDPVVAHLNDFSGDARACFLEDMARLGDAVLAATGAVRINYAVFGNLEPALHAHVIPRYADEPEEFRTKPYWSYDLSSAPAFDAAVHGELMGRIRDWLRD